MLTIDFAAQIVLLNHFVFQGHVYTAIGDYPNALASHKQCVQLVKQMGDRLQESREIGNVGAVYLAMGEFESAVDCHTQHLRLARRLGNAVSIFCVKLVIESNNMSYRLSFVFHLEQGHVDLFNLIKFYFFRPFLSRIKS